MSDIKPRLLDATKEAMKARDQRRLNVLRLMSAAIKQKEIDSRVESGGAELDDQQILAVLDKMSKQRGESIEQYQAANRQDLVDQEAFELTVIADFLPPRLSAEEIDALIKSAISETDAKTGKDMGKVMAVLKPKLEGRADVKQVSEMIKQLLA